MSNPDFTQEVPLPKGWGEGLRHAVIQAIALAHYAVTCARGWAAKRPFPKVRLAAQMDNDQVKWIVLVRPQEKTLLLVLQSWSTDNLTVKLTWDTQVLGVTPGTRALNAENGVPLPVSGGALSVELPGPYGTRLVKMQ